MSEQESGGASSEERAEAEKFDTMINEGKLTPAEMEQVEKSKTPEEVEAEKEAMEKVVNPLDFAVHYTDSLSVGKILKQGILSQKFGKRAARFGLDVDVKPKVFEGEADVYFLQGGHKFAFDSAWGSVGTLFDPSHIKGSTLLRDPWLQMGADPTIAGETRQAHLRIKPKAIIGVILTSQLDEKSAQQVAQESRSCVLPVYDNWGGLKWPRHMNKFELRQFVAEREAKKAEAKEGEQE